MIATVAVRNTVSDSGKEVPNQFSIWDEDGNRYFQSYGSIIVKKIKDGRTILDKNKWDASTTTGKYRNRFLGEDRKSTLKKIKDGTYTLEDLNNGEDQF
jgi:hypothetical protein